MRKLKLQSQCAYARRASAIPSASVSATTMNRHNPIFGSRPGDAASQIKSLFVGVAHALPATANQLFAVLGKHHAIKHEHAILESRPAAQRQAASAVQFALHAAFRLDGKGGGPVLEVVEKPEQVSVGFEIFYRQRALPHGRH